MSLRLKLPVIFIDALSQVLPTQKPLNSGLALPSTSAWAHASRQAMKAES